MTKQQITENYFRELGWKRRTNTENDYPSCLVMNSQGMYLNNYPDITESFSAFKKWVIEEMERLGYELTCGNGACWAGPIEKPESFAFKSRHYIEEPIIDNEILSAAVIAATRFLESEDAKFKIKSK